MAADTRDFVPKLKLFRGLADSSRLSILEALRAGPRSVSAIVEATGLTQPNVSNHLACLHGCGLVARERTGRSVLYRLSDPRVERLLALATELLAGAAAGAWSCDRCAERDRAPAGAPRTASRS